VTWSFLQNQATDSVDL